MKKVIILISIFILCGCSNNLNQTNLDRIESDINSVITSDKSYSNTAGSGYKYYKPRDFSVLSTNNYNETLLHENDKYYLSIDINAFYNNYQNNEVKKDIYYSLPFENENKKGFVEIREGNNGYFYIKMMYNYSYIEVSVEEHNINDSIIDCAIILSSIKYNDKVIEKIITNSKEDVTEKKYEVKKPEVKNDTNGLLDSYDFNN